MDVGASCCFGHAEHLGNLVERQALFVPQRNGHSLFRSKVSDRSLEGLAERLALDRIRGRWRGEIDDART